MDKITRYRALIKDILTQDAAYPPSVGDIETLLIFDENQDSYQLMYVGWNLVGRMHGAVIHMRLKQGKIWIEHDGTSEGVATALVAAGVPKEDIVLAFYSPYKRRFTEFAVN